MDDIHIVKLENNHIAQAADWFEDEGNIPIDTGWALLKNDGPVAIATIRLEQHNIPYFSFSVKPSDRRKGYASKLVDFVLSQPSINSYRNLRATVSFDNTAAQKVLSRHGFSQIGFSEDGQLEFERH